MFDKLVGIEPIRLLPQDEARLHSFAGEYVQYRDIPGSNKEILRRIGDADGVLLSYTSRISGEVLAACPNLGYVGMCCSLYAPESANVDILTAKELGITVTGVRDYGDEGVGEYVVSELVQLLHGFSGRMWRDTPLELTGLPVGVVGLGTSGLLVAKALAFFGADVYYYSRTRKKDVERDLGYTYLELHELLKRVDILCTCVTKNTILLHGEEFQAFGDGKILLNTGIGPSFDVKALASWLEGEGNYFLCDTAMALGDPDGILSTCGNVVCRRKSAGDSLQAYRRLGAKVIANIEGYFAAAAG